MLTQQKYTINCANVISSVGINPTFTLIPDKLHWNVFRKEATSHYYFFIGLKNLGEMVLDPYNTWYMPVDPETYSLDDMMEKCLKKPSLKNVPIFVNFPTGKTKEITDKAPCTVICEGIG